ncbi:MAG: hypothetical protein KJ559_02280 [Nanoarchaeota archaeon]|nr:hypothetical protein [Nanoarchaeota archaeon]
MIPYNDDMKIGKIECGIAYGTLVGACLIAAATIGANLNPEIRSPKKAHIQQDLNQDGVQDLVIESNGGQKTALYGVKEGDKITYISTSEMMKPDSIIDYRTIESKLNE